jgi:hypothetical protein
MTIGWIYSIYCCTSSFLTRYVDHAGVIADSDGLKYT